MRTNRAVVAIPTALLSVGLVAGCGGGGSKAASSATGAAKSAGSSASSSAGASGSSTSQVSCPTSNSKKFAKTRFVADLGLTAGTFHRYIYKPYQAGEFKKGQLSHHKMDVVKAAGAAAADVKLLKNAESNAKANPTLCKKVAQPLSDAMGKLKGVNANSLVTSGGSIEGAEKSIKDAVTGSNGAGNKITENDNLSKAKSLAGN